MLKALKVAMIIYAIAAIAVSVMMIFLPAQFASIFGIEKGDIKNANSVELGFSFIAFGIFLIIAATNPLKYIIMVKFAIVFAISCLCSVIYSIALDYYTIQLGLSGIIIHAVFAIAFLAFYPWKKSLSSSQPSAQKS
jgi:hypothetical protein